jgi:hypothetical protein
MRCTYSSIDCQECKFKDGCEIYEGYRDAAFDAMGEDV